MPKPPNDVDPRGANNNVPNSPPTPCTANTSKVSSIFVYF